MPDGEHRLRVLIADERGRPLAASGLAAWLRRVAPARARGVVNVAVVSDERVRELNRTYRRKDYATDVLSFPNTSLPPGKRRTRATRPVFFPVSPASSVVESLLGDIVIARGIAKRQAQEARHSEQTELRVLALHGLLHLLGYDHERDDGQMLRLERRLRGKGGLREGLIERARPSTGSGRAGRSGHARGELVEPRGAR